MNSFERAFDRLYAVQTRTLKVAILATIGSSATSKPAILGTVRDDDSVVDGGTGQRGGYELQMKASDFTSAPSHDAACAVNGAASGESLVLTAFDNRSSIYVLTVGDPAFV